VSGGKRKKSDEPQDTGEDLNAEDIEDPYDGKIYKVQEEGGAIKVMTILGMRIEGRDFTALVRYTDNTAELIPTKILVLYAPQELLAYYEKRVNAVPAP